MRCPICKCEFSPKSRSHNQNAYYWGVVLSILADHTGDDVESLHEYFKVRFLTRTREAISQTYKYIPSTSDLTIMEFERYISQIVKFASFELGCIIPNPNEKES